MSRAGQVLLAANPLNLDLIGASLALFGAILLGAMILVWVKRWRKRLAEPQTPPPESTEDYRGLYDEGVLSKDEYERIRSHLQTKLQASSAVPPGSAPNSPPTTKGTPSSNERTPDTI